MDSETKFLGEGSQGCVLYPGLTNNLEVNKIGRYDILKNELDNIKYLPDNGPYSSKESYKLIHLKNHLLNKYKDIIYDLCGKNSILDYKYYGENDKLVILEMPLIEGIALSEYLEQELSREQQFNLMSAILTLCDELKGLASNYIYYTDSHPGNYIYNEKTKLITIIDFGSVFIEVMNEKSINSANNVINDIIDEMIIDYREVCDIDDDLFEIIDSTKNMAKISIKNDDINIDLYPNIILEIDEIIEDMNSEIVMSPSKLTKKLLNNFVDRLVSLESIKELPNKNNTEYGLFNRLIKRSEQLIRDYNKFNRYKEALYEKDLEDSYKRYLYLIFKLYVPGY
jgi:hypothetical protein